MGDSILCTGAILVCPFGAAPSALSPIPISRVMISSKPAANIGNDKPFAEVAPCGTCISMANPTVASLTAAALGVLVPAPCTPVVSPMSPGKPTVLLGGMPAAGPASVAVCAMGAGPVKPTFAGQVQVG